jgi:hypothetical protein
MSYENAANLGTWKLSAFTAYRSLGKTTVNAFSVTARSRLLSVGGGIGELKFVSRSGLRRTNRAWQKFEYRVRRKTRR